MIQRILFVDDDANLLRAYLRMMGRRFALDTARSGPEGLELLRRKPFAVVVADLRMPLMDGLRFLEEAGRLAPDAVRILLTGDEGELSGQRALDDGATVRTLAKPCPGHVLEAALADALQEHRQRLADRMTFDERMTGLARMLAEACGRNRSPLFARAIQVGALAGRMSQALGRPDPRADELAALLAPVGCIDLPCDLQARIVANEPLTATDQTLLAERIAAGAGKIAEIPGFEAIAGVVRQWGEDLVSGVPRATAADDDGRGGALLLQAAMLLEGRRRQGQAIADALRSLAERRAAHDPLDSIWRSLLDAPQFLEDPSTATAERGDGRDAA